MNQTLDSARSEKKTKVAVLQLGNALTSGRLCHFINHACSTTHSTLVARFSSSSVNAYLVLPLDMEESIIEVEPVQPHSVCLKKYGPFLSLVVSVFCTYRGIEGPL